MLNTHNQNHQIAKSSSGISVKYIQAHVEQFWNQRKADRILKKMEIDQFIDHNNLENAQIRLLTIKCKRFPYKNKKITIRIEFDDQYPQTPPKMFIVPHNNINFIHANVYEDNGEVCHPVLQRKEYQKFNYKLTNILKRIYQLIYKPNFKNPANIVLGNVYKMDRSQYQEMIKSNAQSLEQVEESQSQSQSEEQKQT